MNRRCPPTTTRGSAVLGIGISSKAKGHEVRELVATALAEHGLVLDDVVVIATRQRFVDDPRLRLGPAVVGFSDAALEAASAPCDRAFGIQARVAETAVALAGAVATCAVFRSAHVTLAIGRAPATAPASGVPAALAVLVARPLDP
jgi:hypothetical protein